MRQFGGDWTREKLERVQRYLCAYTIALRRQPFKLLYVDAFAGAGYCSAPQSCADEDLLLQEFGEDDTRQFLSGSARIALEVKPSFSEYVFIEKSEKNVADLEKLREEFPALRGRIQVVQAEANSYLKELCAGSWADKRAVMFLDPYGMQVNWDTIRSIAATRAVDLWYLFPLGVAVNRLLRKDGMIDQSIRRRLDQLFGESDWYDAFYQTTESLTLWGPEVSTTRVGGFKAISDYLVRRLTSEFAGVANNPLPLLNSKNNPLYLLCFASANPKGAPIALEIAQHILRK